MSDRLKIALNRIRDYERLLRRDCGRLIDPPKFAECFELLDLLAHEVAVIRDELKKWETEENQ